MDDQDDDHENINPKRNLPFALAIGLALVRAVYVVTNLAYDMGCKLR